MNADSTVPGGGGHLLLLLEADAPAQVVLALHQRCAIEVDHAVGVGILDEDEASGLEGVLEGEVGVGHLRLDGHGHLEEEGGEKGESRDQW